MKKVLVTTSLVITSLVTNASALNFFDLDLKGLGCTYYNLQPTEIKKINYCPTNNNSNQNTVDVMISIDATAKSLKNFFGDFSSTTEKVVGGTGISINSNYKNWLWNFRSFVCSLNDEQLKKFSIFTKYIDQTNGGVFIFKILKKGAKKGEIKNMFPTEKSIKKFERSMNYFLYSTSISNDKKVKNFANMSETSSSNMFLARLFFKHRFNYTNDPAIAKFVGAIAQKDFKKALEIIENDERVIEGYNYFNRLCK